MTDKTNPLRNPDANTNHAYGNIQAHTSTGKRNQSPTGQMPGQSQNPNETPAKE